MRTSRRPFVDIPISSCIRAIRHIVRGGKPGRYDYAPKEMERLGAITSSHEKRAEEATRDVEAWLKCQYMEGHLGDEFDGVITGVTNFGLFVQITDLMTDGLVHVTSLANDYYQVRCRLPTPDWRAQRQDVQSGRIDACACSASRHGNTEDRFPAG